MIYTLAIGLAVLFGAALSLPLVDPGLFVISGVSTCGNGTGYCLLGTDCRLNQDFVADNKGHCSGLKGAFTPSAHFVCCTSPQTNNEIQPTTEQPEKETSSSIITSTVQTETETVMTAHQTITSPPDYVQVDTDSNDDEAENSIDWKGVKNLTEAIDTCPPCNTQMVFSLEGSALCLGTHLRHGWILTSGSCALKIFRAGMIKVVGKFIEDVEMEAAVKTIAVHEDYRPYTTNILHPEPNNIGLVLVGSEPKKSCSPCIPDKDDKFAGKICGTIANSTAFSLKLSRKDNMANEDTCESIVETMQGEGTEDFYTIACDNDSRYNGEDSIESGKGLMCRGYVAGIETGSGTGLAVFTRVSQYSDWITTNMMHEQRQSFDVGRSY